MLLAGVLISDLDNFSRNKVYVDTLEEYGKKILSKYQQRIRDVAALDFKRVVFLGSGALKGIARESQLKVQELTDGQVVCKYDSFLGLRHGPKAVIDKSTIVVYLFSRDSYVNQYEMDLVRSINGQKERMYEIGIGEAIKNKDKINLDLSIEVSSLNNIPEEYFAVCSVLPAQMLGLYKSIDLGLSPDSPSVNNTINRVVKGVNIYPYK
ncbi:Galactosamine-6-phosphate isomerase [hydrothermal vent metagenome]|uniref:Galactosamine-6-phosphate isomerase n=1 Tax=hydrothermal vent metagenome TaxID=652676 RepID=A0A3B0UBX6_9ZZZZ